MQFVLIFTFILASLSFFRRPGLRPRRLLPSKPPHPSMRERGEERSAVARGRPPARGFGSGAAPPRWDFCGARTSAARLERMSPAVFLPRKARPAFPQGGSIPKCQRSIRGAFAGRGCFRFVRPRFAGAFPFGNGAILPWPAFESQGAFFGFLLFPLPLPLAAGPFCSGAPSARLARASEKKPAVGRFLGRPAFPFKSAAIIPWLASGLQGLFSVFCFFPLARHWQKPAGLSPLQQARILP